MGTASLPFKVVVAVVVVILRVATADSFAQAFVKEPSELERLRIENSELRKKLAQAEQKLKAAAPKATPTPTEQSRSPKITVKEVASERPPLASFWDRIFLRKSVFSEDVLSPGSPGSISGPAQFTFEHPGHGNDSYSIDSGVALTFNTPSIPNAEIDWGIGLDYHRNSLATSPKNLLQTGVVADSIFGNAASNDFFAWLKASLSYKHDEAKDLQAVAGGLDVLPVTGLLWIDNYHRLGPAHWRWQPFAGLRWESSTEVASGVANGQQVLARYGIEMQVFPLFDYLRRNLELTVTLTAWSDIDSSGPYNTKAWRGYLDANLTYWFSGGLSRGKEKANLGFGLGYENGDNPDLNRAGIDLLTLALRAKF